jgi:hypothetical protein
LQARVLPCIEAQLLGKFCFAAVLARNNAPLDNVDGKLPMARISEIDRRDKTQVAMHKPDLAIGRDIGPISPTSAETSCSTIDDSTLSELALIAKIPVTAKSDFFLRVQHHLTEVWCIYHLVLRPKDTGHLDWVDSELSPALLRSEQSFVALTHAASRVLSSKLDVCVVMQKNFNAFLEECAESKAGGEFVKKWAAAVQGTSTPPTPASPVSFGGTTTDKTKILSFLFDNKTQACILHLAKLAPILQKKTSVQQNSKRRQGRPPSTKKEILAFFIWMFLDTVVSSGGKVSFNRNYETSGTRAMQVLAPFLPPSFPRALSLNVMAEAYQAWKRGRRSENRSYS